MDFKKCIKQLEKSLENNEYKIRKVGGVNMSYAETEETLLIIERKIESPRVYGAVKEYLQKNNYPYL